MDKLNTFFDTKFGVIFTIIAALCLVGWALSSAGIFKGLRHILNDWLLDHPTGKYTINNGARTLLLFAFLFVFIAVHFNITVKPFHITPVPLTEIEMGIILAAIMGLTWVNKSNLNGPDNTKTEVTSKGPTIINTAPQADNNSFYSDPDLDSMLFDDPAPEDEPIQG